MLTWLKHAPKTYRRPARPASVTTTPIELAYDVDEPAAPPIVQELPPPLPFVVEETPPPFFADADSAFLDMGEFTRSEPAPPPLPKHAPPTELTLESRIKLALAQLPPFPTRETADRGAKLMMILRALDQIAGDVCTVLDEASDSAGRLSVKRIPR